MGVLSLEQRKSSVKALRRFIGHRGIVRMLRFENGSIFIVAEKEVSKGFLEMDQNKIRRF